MAQVQIGLLKLTDSGSCHVPIINSGRRVFTLKDRVTYPVN